MRGWVAATPTEAGQAGQVGVAATVEEVAVVDLVEATVAGGRPSVNSTKLPASSSNCCF